MWRRIADDPPPRNTVVLTKIHDEKGERNEQPLKQLERSNLWFYSDGSMYVYYTPTHWKEIK